MFSFVSIIIDTGVFVCSCYKRLGTLSFLSIKACKLQKTSTNLEVSILNQKNNLECHHQILVTHNQLPQLILADHVSQQVLALMILKGKKCQTCLHCFCILHLFLEEKLGFIFNHFAFVLFSVLFSDRRMFLSWRKEYLKHSLNLMCCSRTTLKLVQQQFP